MEKGLSQVACLMDELNGNPVIDANHWSGCHPDIYNKSISKQEADARVAELCRRLQNEDVSKMSLEMQIWWRDHQAADKARIQTVDTSKS